MKWHDETRLRHNETAAPHNETNVFRYAARMIRYAALMFRYAALMLRYVALTFRYAALMFRYAKVERSENTRADRQQPRPQASASRERLSTASLQRCAAATSINGDGAAA
ncbi:MAG TPA: hypothetical protein VGB55_08805, partial [Tepidisphaeraceae bacterium]